MAISIIQRPRSTATETTTTTTTNHNNHTTFRMGPVVLLLVWMGTILGMVIVLIVQSTSDRILPVTTWQDFPLLLYQQQQHQHLPLSMQQQQEETKTKLKPPPHPIFYNLYIPTDQPISNVLNIVREQMQERRAWASHAHVYITLIYNHHHHNATLPPPQSPPPHQQHGGPPHMTNLTATILDLCSAGDANNKSLCTIRQHLTEGNEVDTHQALWEYCRNVADGDDDEWVTYLHDKGSHHATPGNQHARRVATRATLACRHLLLEQQSLWSLSSSLATNHHGTNINATTTATTASSTVAKQCNICGTAMNMVPQYHMNANMWTAKCSYIRQLYEPRHYADAVEAMYAATLLHPQRGNASTNHTNGYACLQPNDWSFNHVGRGRYAAERWALNHFDVQPCSSLGHARVARIDATTMQSWIPQLTAQPRGGPRQAGLQYSRYQSSFARLQGRLWEWQWLYGQNSNQHKHNNNNKTNHQRQHHHNNSTPNDMLIDHDDNNARPPPDSWIWKYYRGFEKGSDAYLQKCQAVAAATPKNAVEEQ